MSEINTYYPEPLEFRKKESLRKVNKAGGAYKHHKRTAPEPLIAETSVKERREAVLDRLDRAGLRKETSPKSLSAKGLITAGALSLGALMGPGGGANVVGNVVSSSGERIEDNFDKHNLPPTGEPMEYRGGIAYEPGTENIVTIPDTPKQP